MLTQNAGLTASQDGQFPKEYHMSRTSWNHNLKTLSITSISMGKQCTVSSSETFRNRRRAKTDSTKKKKKRWSCPDLAHYQLVNLSSFCAEVHSKSHPKIVLIAICTHYQLWNLQGMEKSQSSLFSSFLLYHTAKRITFNTIHTKDFSLGVNMGSNSISPKTPSNESINRGLVYAHMHFIAQTQKILTFMS